MKAENGNWKIENGRGDESWISKKNGFNTPTGSGQAPGTEEEHRGRREEYPKSGPGEPGPYKGK